MKTVNIEEILKIQATLKEINNIPLEDIIFMKDGKEVKVSAEEIKDWSFMGLSNVSFIEMLLVPQIDNAKAILKNIQWEELLEPFKMNPALVLEVSIEHLSKKLNGLVIEDNDEKKMFFSSELTQFAFVSFLNEDYAITHLYLLDDFAMNVESVSKLLKSLPISQVKAGWWTNELKAGWPGNHIKDIFTINPI